MTKATLREEEKARIQNEVGKKVKMSYRNKKRGVLVRYERVANLAQEIALIPGGFGEFSKWVRASALREKKFEPLVVTFFQLPLRRQNALELEEMALTFGISPAELLGVCVEIAYEKKRSVSKLLQSVAMPAIIQRNIVEAKKVKGVQDREMFMKSTGVLPVPKGSTMNINATAQAAAMTTEGEPTGLPDFEESTLRFSEVIRNAAERPAAMLAEPIPEAVIVDEEQEAE